MAKACKVSNVMTGVMAKFLALYEGPYKIEKQVATNVYILYNLKSDGESGQYHVIDLRKYRRKFESGEKENEATLSDGS